MMENLQARHHKEQRDLQSRITQKRKNATKKTRKGVNDECDVLQRDLQERQQAELTASDAEPLATSVDALQLNGSTEKAEIELGVPQSSTSADEKSEHDVAMSSVEAEQPGVKKQNRQKTRLARRAAEQEALAAQAAKEAADLPDLREQEMKAMQEQMEKLGLKEVSIRPDGHCLYSAVATGLQKDKVKASGPYAMPYQNVRLMAGNFISEHSDDFMAFLEEPIDSYVYKVKHTAEWGGQPELQAIARAYAVDINVLQANGRVEKIESGADSLGSPVWLAYYRHSFGLGEHYNALKFAG